MGAIAVFGSAQIPDYYEVLEEKEWQQVFSEIATQSIPENIITIKGENRLIEHEILYLVDAISRFWNLKPNIIPKPKPPQQKEFQCAGRLYYNLMALVVAVWSRSKNGYAHPAFWFRDVYLEAEVTTPFRGKDDNADGPATAEVGKDQVIRLVKSQNGALRKRYDEETDKFLNPFSRPATKMLFDLAVRYAIEYNHPGNDGGFYKNTYLPFINARTEALKWWERHGILCIVHNKKTYMSVKSHGFREFNPTKDVKGLRA